MKSNSHEKNQCFRKPVFLCILLLCVAGIAWLPGSLAQEQAGVPSIRPVSLCCEYLVNPLGIDSLNPRLSWVLEPVKKELRNLKQTAYEIRVATNIELLKSGEPDLWNSGRVDTEQSIHVKYNGKKLKSGMRCWWEVRVSDQAGLVSQWSEPAWWEMGLLKRKDWGKARWIGTENRTPSYRTVFTVGGDYIWTGVNGGLEYVYLFKELNISETKQVSDAKVYLRVKNRSKLYINGDYCGMVYTGQITDMLDVTGNLKPGRNSIAIKAFAGNKGDGISFRLDLNYANGSKEQVLSDDTWLVSTREQTGWKTAGFKPEGWDYASVKVKYKDQHSGNSLVCKRASFRAPLMRRSFKLSNKIKSARAYICGLGYYELYLNGRKVGDHVLDPGQTNYEEFALYVSYDITEFLREGDNAAGIILGNGMYNQSIVWGGGMKYGDPCVICKIRIDFEDGTNQKVVTNRKWRVMDSPITFNNVYAGEDYDARLEIPGWNEPGLDDSGWQEAVDMFAATPGLVSQLMPPIRKTETIKPIGLSNPEAGVWVYDMGQNIAGWARLKVRAPEGTRIRLRYTEEIHDDGNINPTTTGVYHTWYIQEGSYICSGSGVETWESRFTYHGFRYVEVTGLPYEPGLDLLEGVVAHTDVDTNGMFTCSDDLINRIHETSLWTVRDNIHSIPTDCPQREKCGWAGDAHIMAETTIYNYDMTQFWTKYMMDIKTSLGMARATYTGRVPEAGIPCNIAPGKRRCLEARPDWGVVVVLLPWYMYLYYDDTEVFSYHYKHIKRYVDHLSSLAEAYIVKEGYGDWCPPRDNMECPVPLSSTAFYYHVAGVLADIAQLLGKTGDSTKYRELSVKTKDAFIREFYDSAKNTYGSQTANSIALHFGLIPEGRRGAVAGSLKGDVLERHKGHLNTGIFGNRYIHEVLSNEGHDDVVYGLLTKTGYPSYSDAFSQGATTWWESFEPDRHGNRSHNHPMQAGFDSWFYYGVGGIMPDKDNPGFKHTVISPRLVNQLKWAKAEYKSMYGNIESSWLRDGKKLEWSIIVPPNTTATVHVPTGSAEDVMEGTVKAGQAPGVKYIGFKAGRAVYDISSGSYEFSSILE